MRINTLKALFFPFILSSLLLAAILIMYSWLDLPETLHIEEARFTQSNAMLPPDFSSQQTEKRALPDNWLKSMGGFGGSGWYEMHVPKQAQQGHVWGMFIPRANMNVAVFLNHNEIGHSGHFSEPVSRNWARPLYYSIPAGLLTQTENIIHIHLKSYANEAGGLSKILLGEQDSLLPLYQMRYFIQIDLAKISFFLNIFLGTLTLLLWHLRRSETLYMWFSITCFSSSIFILNTFLIEIPFNRDMWHFIVYISIGWFACSLLMFTLYFLNKVNRLWEYRLLAYMLISSMIILALQNIFIALFWHIGSLIMAGYASYILLRSWSNSQESSQLILSLAILTALVLGFHDWYTRLSLQQFSSPVLMHLGPPIMLMAIAWILSIRFMAAMDKIEGFNVTIVERIQETTERLNTKHQQLQVLLQQEIKENERNRIMKDLHDGLGNYLMAAHSIARIKQVDHGLQQALNDALFWLRTSIDTLANEDADMSTLLGTFRHRIEPQLAACGITLHWHMDDISSYQLPTEHKLHLIRIIQESITNVIKHAAASTLHIMVHHKENGSISLSIQDNGCGILSTQQGHGLKNMQERIDILGGSMQINALPSGTQLIFTLP